ncbi:MAG TPA: protein kinase [Pyrinomonadaceae bacterium]|jgi:Tol biopolymer transport system component/predicted Ser/Thr protein kinase
MLEANDELGRYRIQYSLAVGGMGEVYLAEDRQLERKVALKILPAEVAQNAERMQRFIREAKTASALNHPNIAHIYEIGEEKGVHFIAMEFIEGKSLHAKIHAERAELKELLKYFLQIAEGLAKAHAAGIVHRDLKPDNIMISTDGYAKILDFGLAKLVEPRNPQSADSGNLNDAATEIFPQPLSAPGIIMGTAGYMSPEQAQGKRDIDQRSDVFSFGCILYEAVTLRQPFAGETIIDSLHKIVYSQPAPITEFNPAAPADLQRVVRRCLQKNPDDRYQTIKDAAIELRELQHEIKSAAQDAHPAAARTTADSHGAKNEGLTSAGGRKTVALSSDRVIHTTSSAEYLVNEIKQHKTGVFVAFALLAVLTGLGFAAYKFYSSRASSNVSPSVMRTLPLTSSPEIERNPALSPDGKQLAFAWTGEGHDNYDIYVKIVDAGTPLRLTTSPEAEMSPAWSPDSRFIAFLRGTGENKGFYIVPALGGAERKIADAYGRNGATAQPQALDWSPDGKTLAVVDKISEDAPWSVFLVSIETGEKRQLTVPPVGYAGDLLIAFSPDGRQLAFVRRVEAGVSDIYLIPAEGGEPAPVTRDALTVRGLDWTGDGERIVFSSERSGGYATLWTVPADGAAAPAPVAGTGENTAELSVSLQGNRLAYAQLSADTNLWRVAIPDGADKGPPKTNPPAKFISSTRMEEDPRYSPDGKRIAFSSNRSGSFEIWVANGDGQNPVQLTNFNSSAVSGSPSWSPDGRFIAFDSRAEGNADIYVVNADGGSPRRLTTGASEDAVPSWSRDGRFLYFASKRTARFEIWKMPATGGEAVQVTHDGGFISSESTDGRVLYFTKGRSDTSLWSLAAEGGAENKVIENNVGRSWTVTEQGIYFLASGGRNSEPFTIEFYDFGKRQVTRLAAVEKPSPVFAVNVAAVSPDRRWMIYAQRDQLDYDVILIENFN